MATYVEYSFAHIIGSDVDLFSTAAEAVAEAGLTNDDECSVYLFIFSDGAKRWGVKSGHDGHGVHTTAESALTAEVFFEDSWCFTDDAELAEKLNS